MHKVEAQPVRGIGIPSDEAGIMDQLRVLRRHWLLIGTVMVLGTGSSMIVARLIQPVFVARTEVIYEPVSNGGLDGFEQVAAAPEGGTLDSQVQQIESRAIAREVFQRLGLDNDPELVSLDTSLRTSWLGLGPARASALQVLDATVPFVPMDPPEEALDAFLSRLQVGREGKSHVLEITWRSTDPHKAAAVANEVAQAFVTARIAEKHVAATRTAERLRQRRDALRTGMFEAEAKLTMGRAAAGPLLTAALGGGEDQINTLSRQWIDAKIDAGTRSGRVRRLKDAARHGNSRVMGGDQGPSILFQNLMAEDAQTAREEGQLTAELGERHPRVIDLRSRRSELRRYIQAEQSRMLEEMDMEAQIALTRADDLAAQLDALKGSTAGLVQGRQDIALLEDDVRSKRSAFELFDAKFVEITQQLADQSPDARIVSEASPPASPAFPKPGSFMAVGGSVSFLLAGLFVWFSEVRDRSIHTARDLESVTGLVTVAMVPRLVRKNERSRPHDVALDQPLGRYGEALRDMLAAVTQPFDRPDGRGMSVLITSAVPDEGKTTTAISLARLAAAEGLKVILIDGDLRHPSVLERLGLDKGPGLQEILMGKATLEQALRTDPRSGLRILPGSQAARAALASQHGDRLRQVVHSLIRDVDLVVVDAAPVLAVADTKLLARAVDHVLLLARWGKTSDRLIARAVTELREIKAPLAGAVLTAVNLDRQALYGLDDRTFAYIKHAHYYASKGCGRCLIRRCHPEAGNTAVA